MPYQVRSDSHSGIERSTDCSDTSRPWSHRSGAATARASLPAASMAVALCSEKGKGGSMALNERESVRDA